MSNLAGPGWPLQTWWTGKLRGFHTKRLRDVRPRAPYREVFLRLKAPFGPLSSGVLYDVVSERLRALALPLRHSGPHALRHACATHLLAQGVSLKAIGDHLGHRKAD